MKTTKFYFKTIFALMMSFAFPTGLFAEDYELNETFHYTFETVPQCVVILDNYESDLKIEEYDGRQVVFELDIQVSSEEKEAIDELRSYLKNRKFTASTSKIELDNHFYSNIISQNLFFWNSTKMTLKNGRKIPLSSDVKMSGYLKIPRDAKLELSSKYSRIDISPINNLTSLKLYEDKLFGSEIGSNTNIDAKYTEITLSRIKNAEMNVYECTLNIEKTDDLVIESKYSKFFMKECGNLKLDSYEDEFQINKCGNVNIKGLYVKLNVPVMGDFTADLYEGTVETDQVKDIVLTSKYGNYIFLNTGKVNFSTSYEDNFRSTHSTTFECPDSKYLTLEISQLDETLKLNAYENKITVRALSPKFKGADLTLKYGECRLGIPMSVSHELFCKLRDSNYNIDESKYKRKTYIKEDSDLVMRSICGTEKEGMPLVSINGYDLKLDITGL